MLVELSRYESNSLLTVTGDVREVDVPALRARLLDALEANPGDVLLDMRQVRSMSDRLTTALTAARSRAKYLRRHIVVIDADDGITTSSLRRLGLQFRFPVYGDPAAAAAGLRADQEARDRLVVGHRATPQPAPTPASGAAGGSTKDDPDEPGPSASAGPDPVQHGSTGAARIGSPALPMQGSRRPTRTLQLRGGQLHGLHWTGDIDVGSRVCCGTGAWMPSHVYVVTAQVVRGPAGEEENVAVPAAF